MGFRTVGPNSMPKRGNVRRSVVFLVSPALCYECSCEILADWHKCFSRPRTTKTYESQGSTAPSRIEIPASTLLNVEQLSLDAWRLESHLMASGENPGVLFSCETCQLAAAGVTTSITTN